MLLKIYMFKYGTYCCHSRILNLNPFKLNLVSVECKHSIRAADKMTGRSRFDPWQRRKDFSSNLCVQTGCGARQASCPMGTGVLSSGVKRGLCVTLTIPLLVPRSWMSRSYTSSPPSAFMACSGTALLLPQRKCNSQPLQRWLMQEIIAIYFKIIWSR
jgi:hypothetical protein